MSETVSLDSTGKMYFPQKVREQMKVTTFTPLVLPDGQVILVPSKKRLPPREALKAVRAMGLWKTKKSIQELRAGV